MSAEAQTEKAFQKQAGVFLNAKSKRSSKAGSGKPKAVRYFKSVGLGFRLPKEAVTGTFVDKKCPYTGGVSVRGRVLKGEVTSTKMKRTITIRRDYLHFIRKYDRFEKRHSKISAHLSPAFSTVKEGDVVTVGECRPLAKTVSFNVLEISRASSKSGKLFKAF